MTSIQQRIDQLVHELGAISEPDERYKYMIQKGKESGDLTDPVKEEKFLIAGCLSRAWLIPEYRDGKLFFKIDSEAAIVKGIMAIIVHVYSGATPREILASPPEFLQKAGINEHLSMNRRNGLASLVKQLMLYATVYARLAANPS
jgi:cysteine desulfuration protein SufE